MGRAVVIRSDKHARELWQLTRHERGEQAAVRLLARANGLDGMTKRRQHKVQG